MIIKRPPPSATPGGIVLVSLIAFLLSLIAVKFLKFFETPFENSIFLILTTASAIFISELVFFKTHLRASTGLNFKASNPSWRRTFTKFLGLLASLGFIALLYWLFPEYQGDFYNNYYSMLKVVLPWGLLGSIPYIYFVDSHQIDPKDSYYYIGQFCLLNFEKVDGRALKSHVLGWLVKGFFLPLMFTYLTRDVSLFTQLDFSKVTGFKAYFDFLYDLLFTIDVGIVSMGYIMAFRLTDTHLRSAEPTFLGWAVALMCYQPFWSMFSRQYLNYDSRAGWASWFSESPTLFTVWGCGILFLFSIYVWASLTFGCRFSNLTHRGILTNGPYRWTKHPAYISKCIAWWMISLPFMVSDSVADSFKKTVLLLMLSGVYFLRARTEEKHLSLDPVYVEYAEWIKDFGLISRIKKTFVSR